MGPVSIEVVSADWRGRSREQPEPVTKQVSVSQGDTFEAGALGEGITFTVRVPGTTITLTTS